MPLLPRQGTECDTGAPGPSSALISGLFVPMQLRIDPTDYRSAILLRRWLLVIGLLLFHVVLLVVFRGRFAHERELVDIPALWLAAGLFSAGVVYLAGVVRAMPRTAPPDTQTERQLLSLVFAGGVLMRVLLLWSTPALEDDFYRYLWDGGVVVDGTSPYAYPPERANTETAPQRRGSSRAGRLHPRTHQSSLFAHDVSPGGAGCVCSRTPVGSMEPACLAAGMSYRGGGDAYTVAGTSARCRTIAAVVCHLLA